MKLVTLTVFGAGYVLGTRAGRERYEQLAEAARRIMGGLDGPLTQGRFDQYAGRLEAFAARNGHRVADDVPHTRTGP